MNAVDLACLLEVITAEEAAKMLKLSRKRVRDLCIGGQLSARQSSAGKAWLISKTSVERRLNGQLS